MQRPLAIGIVGADGRMGRNLIRLIGAASERFHLAGAWVGPDNRAFGADAGEAAGVRALGAPLSALGTAEFTGVDVVVDFSTPAATAAAARLAAQAGVAFVTGTTGLDVDAERALGDAAEHVPVLAAANFSLGAAVLAELVALARRRLREGFDVEIFELHHRGKRDAPSGTARSLGREAGDEAGAIRTGARRDREVGYAALRGGGGVGEHTVFFLGDYERLELTHRAHDRDAFAAGALDAAEWLVRQSPGRHSLVDYLVARSRGD